MISIGTAAPGGRLARLLGRRPLCRYALGCCETATTYGYDRHFNWVPVCPGHDRREVK